MITIFILSHLKIKQILNLTAKKQVKIGSDLGSTGGPYRTRTYDLLIKSQQLYQLS